MPKRSATVPVFGILAATLALAGCHPRDDAPAARGDDTTTVAQAQPQPRTGPSAAHDSDRRDVGRDMRQSGRDLRQSGRDATDAVSDKVSDAVITSSVNAELARDPQLSALKIDVDTAGGRVALHGSAPDDASRVRATQLASNVDGVVSVDNQLTVRRR